MVEKCCIVAMAADSWNPSLGAPLLRFSAQHPPKGQAHGWHSLGQKHSVSKGHRGRQATEGSGQLTGAEPLARDEAEPPVSLQSPMFKQLCETLCCIPVQSSCTN